MKPAAPMPDGADLVRPARSSATHAAMRPRRRSGVADGVGRRVRAQDRARPRRPRRPRPWCRRRPRRWSSTSALPDVDVLHARRAGSGARSGRARRSCAAPRRASAAASSRCSTVSGLTWPQRPRPPGTAGRPGTRARRWRGARRPGRATRRVRSHSSAAANSLRGLLGGRADRRAPLTCASTRPGRARSARRSRPSRSRAPATTQRRSALGSASTRRWPATVTTSSSPVRVSSRSSRRASGSASDSTKPSVAALTVTAARPRSAQRHRVVSPYSGCRGRPSAASPTGSAAAVGHLEHRQAAGVGRGRRRAARPAPRPSRRRTGRRRPGRPGWRRAPSTR